MDNIINTKTNDNTIISGITKQKSKIKIFLALLAIIYFVGILLGSLLLKSEESNFFISTISEILKINLQGRIDFSFAISFNSIAFQGYILLILIFLLGFFVYAKPIMMMLFLIKGVSIGVLASALVINYGAKGLLYFVIAVFIPQVIYFALLMVLTKEAILFKNTLFLKMDNKIVNRKKMYFVRFFVILVVNLMVILFEILLIFLCKGILK